MFGDIAGTHQPIVYARLMAAISIRCFNMAAYFIAIFIGGGEEHIGGRERLRLYQSMST